MRRAVPLFLVALATVPTSASAAWTPATDLAPRIEARASVKVAAAADGSALVGFEREDRVYLALKPSGAPLGALVDLGEGSNLAVAMAPSGRAVAAWSGSSDAPGLHVAVREPGGALTETPFVPSDRVIFTTTTVARDGRAFVGSNTTTRSSLLAVDAGSLTRTPLASGPVENVDAIALATQPTGDKAWFVVQSSRSDGTSAGLKLTTWQSTTGASDPQPFADGGTTTSVASLRAVDGIRPSFFWTNAATSGGRTSYTMHRAEPGNAPGETAELERLLLGAFSIPSISAVTSAVGSDGNTTVAWSATDADASTASISTRPGPGGAFGPKTPITGDLAPSSALRDLAVVPSIAPRTTVVELFGNRAFAGVVDPSGATYGPTSQITTPFGDYQSKLSAGGTGFGETIAAWLATGPNAKSTVQVTTNDEVAPALAVSSDVPASPSPGQRITFSATAVDRFSATGDITWDFGDGTTAAGTPVAHAFAAGTHTVTATVADAAGNVATKTLQVVVPGPPSATAPPAPTRVATPGVDTTVPKLTGLKLSASAFAVTKGKPTKGKGTTIRFTLSAAAKVELRVSSLVKGYVAGKKCATKKPRGKGKSKAKTKRCWIRKSLGLAGAPTAAVGANSIAFDGTVAGKALKPGTYELTAAPVPPLASHGTAAAIAKFTIKR
ncbi:MAG: PKD domain-containing protein [Solirubrobacteraceae bacterium]|nr:PKD domain-containing protein [Solirubrobacteraceae bacterium]